MGLASGAIHGLDPQDAVLLIITGKDDSVTFLHCIEESPATIQPWYRERSWNYRDTVGLRVAIQCVGVPSHQAVGHCSLRYTHPAGEAPGALTFSPCSCTWRTYTDSPTKRRTNCHNELQKNVFVCPCWHKKRSLNISLLYSFPYKPM